ncbi:MAG: hypothetical protein A2089_00640 [Elusimicrobia bacterium GWD2_63_28]|nr:MAG: hypothetical protein A2089_00640 [Elusimicrobia bacterium GWD2_63_28]
MLSGVLIMLAAYAAVFAGAEYLLRRGWPPLLTRKSAHAAGGLVSCALPIFVTKAAAVSIGAGVSLFVLAAARRGALRSVREGGLTGAVLFPAGLALSVLLFWGEDAVIFQWSALLLGLADAAAGAGGGLWGRRKYSITGHKTIEGSLLFFVVSLALLGAFMYFRQGSLTPAAAAAAAAGALAVTAVESALGKGWDNLGVPLAAGGVLLLLK